MTDCPNCILLNAVADDGRARVCGPCRRAAAPRVAARPLAPLPPPSRVPRPRRAEAISWNADRDLDALARVLPMIDGRAMGIEPSIPSGRAVDGRPDHVDAADLTRGFAALDRLAAVRAAPDGERVAGALVFVFLLASRETRALPGFNERLGLAFALRSQRLEWLLNPSASMGEGGARESGTRLRDAAVAVFQDAVLAPAAGLTPGWHSALRDAVLRRASEADADAKALRRTREQNRCATPATPGAPNRRERRKALQARPGNTGNRHD